MALAGRCSTSSQLAATALFWGFLRVREDRKLAATRVVDEKVVGDDDDDDTTIPRRARQPPTRDIVPFLEAVEFPARRANLIRSVRRPQRPSHSSTPMPRYVFYTATA